MDAIMLALVAVLLANADGRSGQLLHRLITARRDRRAAAVILVGAFLINALIAAIAGALANRMIGQGIAALFVGFAMLAAAGALLWRGGGAVADARTIEAPPALLAIQMLALQFGDRSHFLIASLAATSGAGMWAASGGFVGWALALLPFLAFGPALAAHPMARVLRWGAAAILALWGIRSVMTAFGL